MTATPAADWHFDHLNVAASANNPKLEALAQLLGLAPGHRPPFPFPGAWFYQGEAAHLHVVDDPAATVPVLHHIAFRSDAEFDEVIAQVRRLNLDYRIAHVPEERVAQVFVRFSDTLLIELDLPASKRAN